MRALRFLRQSPALAAVAILSVALGIAANVTIFSVVREMVLDDLSAIQPGRLVRVDTQVTFDQYRQLRDAHIFQDLAFQLGFGDVGWQRERVWRLETSANFFEVLGVRPSQGRLYGPSDENAPVAVVSYGFWQRRLRGKPGDALELNGRVYTVVGILPRDYRSVMGNGVSPEVYYPAAGSPAHCHPFGRLPAGLTREQTRQALQVAAARIGGADFSRQVSTLRPMAGLAAHYGAQGDPGRFFVFFLMLFGVAGMLALIACSNGAALLLARSAGRRKELAIRKALGAGRWQLARPLLGEGLGLVACGTAAGLALDSILRSQLRGLRWPSAYNIPIEFHFESSGWHLLYALLAAGIALLITSGLPAWRGSNADLALAMKQGEPAFSARRWSLRNGFVLLQVVLSTTLLLLGALFVRSFATLARGGAGFDDGHTLIAAVHGTVDRDALVRRIRAIPGVVNVTSIGLLPLMGELPLARLRLLDDPLGAHYDAYSMGGGEGYFVTLGIPILRGRDFALVDRDRTLVPAIVSRSLARRMFGERDPLGARLINAGARDQVLEIVGVAADTRLRTLGEDHEPVIYTPFFQAQFIVRVGGDPARWTAPLHDALALAAPTASMDVHPLSDAVRGALFPMRMASLLVGSLGALGMLLSLAGLYGSVAWSVGRRTREMGIRSALGATAWRITRTAVSDAVPILGIGAALGTAIGTAVIRPLVNLLPDGLNAWDPLMLAAPALLLLAGALAAWIPASRAARVDPSIALRQD